jgi:hypothetical protein
VIIDEVIARFAELLPASIEAAHESPAQFSLVGNDWLFAAICPWRVTRRGVLLSGGGAEGAAAGIRSLEHSELRAFLRRGSTAGPEDPVLVLSNDTVIELFVDSHLDPWSATVEGKTWVADGCGPGRGKAADDKHRCSRALNGVVTAASYEGTELSMAGDQWKLIGRCPWRLSRAGAVISGWNAAQRHAAVTQLIGGGVVEMTFRPGAGGADDLIVWFDDDVALEVFADSDDAPWTLKVESEYLVGRASERTS